MPLKKLVPYISGAIDTIASIGSSSDTMQLYHDIAKKYNFKLYGLCGTYTGEEGELMPNRYKVGFQLYKSGVQGCAIWTWQRPDTKNPWDDIEVATCMAYPSREISDKEVNTPTLQLEGVREGIDDYCYIYTLQQWIKRTREKGFVKDAEQSGKKLNEIMNSVPFGLKYILGNSYSCSGNFDNVTAQKCCWLLAKEIIELQKILERNK